MSNGFYNEYQVTIRPGELKEMAFGIGENPNHFYVNNLSGATLYCGISFMPSAAAAEMKVEGNTAKLAARRDGSQRFYIYNSSKSREAKILLSAFNETFNPVVLALANQSMSIDFEGVTIEGGGNIEEISCPLPGGSNSIGFVGLNAGGNHVGSVAVDAVPSVLETAAGKINQYMESLNDAAYDIKVLAGDLKALQGVANDNWSQAKIAQLMAAITNIAAVAGGEEFTGTLEVKKEQLTGQLVWNLLDEKRYINNLNYIRCTKGSLTVALNGGSDVITLTNGDIINDVAGKIESMTITPGADGGNFEMLYSYIATV